MARNVFFTFDYDDILAVNVVRNANVVRAENQKQPFLDKSLYEAAKNTPGAIKRAIDASIDGTTVTVVLNGASTAYSEWVRYEIAKSFERGNGFLVVDITNVGPRPSVIPGPNPLSKMGAALDDDDEVNVHLFEHDGKQWIPYVKLLSVSNATAKYPSQLIQGGGYRLEQRFAQQFPWRDVQANFSSFIEKSAIEAGWPRSTVWI